MLNESQQNAQRQNGIIGGIGFMEINVSHFLMQKFKNFFIEFKINDQKIWGVLADSNRIQPFTTVEGIHLGLRQRCREWAMDNEFDK